MTLDQFYQKLTQQGFNFSLTWDGRFHRFDRNGTMNAWFVGRSYNFSGNDVFVARYGDWRTDEKYEWRSQGDLSDEEAAEVGKAMREQERAERLERERIQEETATEALRVWDLAEVSGRSPYFFRKGLGDLLYGCRLDHHSDAAKKYGPQTLIAARDISGKLWGIQRIGENGFKSFMPGMKIRGCFHLIGEIDAKGEIYVCEGIATAASVHQATGRPAVAAFNAGNLTAVAEALRSQHPPARIIICGDDDRWTTRPSGEVWNPGREKAELAAQACGSRAVFPVFTDLSSRPTDFNDLHVLEGIAKVTEQLESKDIGPGALPAEYAELQPLPWKKKGNRETPPDQQAVADRLLDFYGDTIIKQDRVLYRYETNRWKLVNQAETDQIYRQLQFLYSGKATASQLESMYKLFLMAVPAAPVNMFAPKPFWVNFLNGTLHVVEAPDGTFSTVFKPHSKQDYLTNTIPLNYEPEKGEKNAEFLAMLERVFLDDPDKDEKIRAVRQMYGACLLPRFPHLFILHGPAGSGKSSLIIPAMRLVHTDNWCSVEPHQFKDFNMESMAGKLVNFVTDINMTRPIEDANVKKIEDRQLIRIQRKYKEDLYSPLPAIHIFGANGLPPTQDGASGAHDRRWTFLKVEKYKAQGTYRKDFANWVFDQCPHGILNFALEGLQDLLANKGHFLNPASGVKDLTQWQVEHDAIGMFLQEAGAGGVRTTEEVILSKGVKVNSNTQVKVGLTYRIPTTLLWVCFKQFHLDTFNAPPKINKFQFYSGIEAKLGPRVTIHGAQHFQGLGVFEVETSIC
jgi:phage/plasmid primase-like uncharacterized protein/phage/plasmid-associated DNA primase